MQGCKNRGARSNARIEGGKNQGKKVDLQEFRGTRIQRCKDAFLNASATQECRDAEMQMQKPIQNFTKQCKGAGVPEYRGTRSNARIQRCKDTRVQGCKDSGVHPAFNAISYKP